MGTRPLLSGSPLLCVAGLLLALLSACAAPDDHTEHRVNLRYVGSSTIAHFMRDADQNYPAASFSLDTAPESSGGEAALLAGDADIAGVARPPGAQVLNAGFSAAEIGRDAIAIVVHPSNPVGDLSLTQLKDIFSGITDNWSQVGGPDLAIEAYVVSSESATRYVFRSAVLGPAEYDHCQVVRPDQEIITRVAESPGAIGLISFAFLTGASDVSAVAVGGQPPTVTNFDYPITRSLYLLWKKGRAEVDDFVAWALSKTGQQVVMGHFVGNRVIGSVQAGRGAPSPAAAAAAGSLVVFTDTDTVDDGGLFYYPHLGYEVLTRGGQRVRRVPNHRGDNDESPTRVSLPPGTYLIRAETADSGIAEFFVTIVSGETTTVSVDELQRERL